MIDIKKFLHANGGTILSLLGCAGFAASYILCLKESEDCELDTPKEKLRAHIPSAAIGLGSMAAVAASSIISKKHTASIISAYSLLQGSHSAYRAKVEEKYGVDAERDIEASAASETMLARDILAYHKLHLDIPDKKMIFRDQITDQEFIAYEREVMDAEYHLNRNYILAGSASVGEYAEFLGIAQEPWMYDTGWLVDGNEVYWLDFTHKIVGKDDETGLDICCIYPEFDPSVDWLAGRLDDVWENEANIINNYIPRDE